MRALAFLAFALLLCIDGWGCGANASEPEYGDGWCCDGLCGLTGAEAYTHEICFCDGYTTPATEGSRGECIEGSEQ